MRRPKKSRPMDKNRCLPFGVRVFNGDGAWVVKDPYRVGKLHAMFLDIGCGLGRVPLVIYVHLLYVQGVHLSRRKTRETPVV